MVHFIILFCALFAPCFAESDELHYHMTMDEVQEVFDTTHDNVPEYQVVPISYRLHRRDTNKLEIKTKINGMDRKFYLEPVEGLLAGGKTKVWIAKKHPRNPDKLIYIPVEDVMDEVVQFYQDEETLSSISHQKGGKNSSFTGWLNKIYKLRSLPESYRQRRDLSRTNISSLEIDEDGYIKSGNHILIKTSPHSSSDSNHHERTKRGITDFFKNTYNKIWSIFSKPGMEKSKKETPSIVYPEIMVMVDNVLFNRFDNNSRKAVQYILSFWNAVDLRFRTLENPKVRLNIAGIILAMDEPPFIDTAVVEGTSRTDVEDVLLVYSFGHFLFNEKKFKVTKDYDLAILMTERDLVDEPTGDKTVLGAANLGGACSEVRSREIVEAVGIIKDSSGYDGILTTAHEVAHLLGAPHDNETSPAYLGGPGALHCLWGNGFLMSYVRKDKNKIMFSPCSQESMAYFFSRKNAECLRNDPAEDKENKPLPRMLPGKYITLDEQCQKQGFIEARDVDPTVCLQLWCLNYATIDGTDLVNHYASLSPAAEGSTCGENKYCISGECTLDPDSSQLHIIHQI